MAEVDENKKLAKRFSVLSAFWMAVAIGVLIYSHVGVGRHAGEFDRAAEAAQRVIDSLMGESLVLKKQDSLIRVELAAMTEKMRRMDEQFATSERKINLLKTNYEKIDSRYRDVSADSIGVLFAERFRQY